MKGLAIVFARAPRLGTVKRRLAAGVGHRAALRFHTVTLARTLHELARDRRFDTVVALTPPRARSPLLRHVASEAQMRGDLGRRMDAAFAHHPRRRVVLVGCDIPELRAGDVVAALRALGKAQAVFGPAADGGYWLVGFGPRRPDRPFHHVRWSTEHALADTRRNLRGTMALVRTLRDVDTAADLLRVSGARSSGA